MNKNEAMLMHLLTEAVIGLMEGPKGGGTISIPVSTEGKMQRKMEGLKGRKRVAMGLSEWRDKAIYGIELWDMAYPDRTLPPVRILQTRLAAWQKFRQLTAKQKSMLLPTLRTECENIGKRELKKLAMGEVMRKSERAKAARALEEAEKFLQAKRDETARKDKQAEATLASDAKRADEIREHLREE